MITTNRRGFTLVELMVVVVIIGMLASIAGFGFMQYVRKSKTAEVDEFTRRLADSSRAYFSSMQVYGGGENFWHTAGARGSSTAPGIPVPLSEKTFPGGDGWSFATHSTPPVGGTKAAPDRLITALGGANSRDKSALKKLNYNVTGPTYFSYSYTSTDTGNSAAALIQAIANFSAGGAENHTVNLNLSVDRGEVKVGVPYTLNEFE